MTEKPYPIKRQISSGGVIFRSGTRYDSEDSGQRVSNDNPENTVEVALVAVKGGKVWCLPKGTIDRGEEPAVTALREVREETGLSGDILDKIGQISYWYFLKEEMARVHKIVHFYLIKYVGGSTGDHDMEVDEAKWFRIDEAMDRLTYQSERDIVQKAKKMIEERQSSN